MENMDNGLGKISSGLNPILEKQIGEERMIDDVSDGATLLQ